jgi:ATP-dependent Clp protease ATP-binding subunit ClpA
VFERLTEDARRALLAHAKEEAQRRGDRRVGTDHLLLGLLHDPRGLAARTLGVDLAAARAAADALDRAALAAIGVDLGEQRLPAPTAAVRRPALSSGARTLLMRSVEEARRTRARRIQPRHLLLAVLSLQRPDPAAELLTALGVDAARTRARLTS